MQPTQSPPAFAKTLLQERPTLLPPPQETASPETLKERIEVEAAIDPDSQWMIPPRPEVPFP
jgi:hypothetical protein